METLLGEFSTGLFIWQTILFLGLVILLRRFAWKPILTAVNEREQKIEGALEGAKAAEAKMAELKAENETLLKAAREERDNMLKEARAAKEAIVLEAHDKAKKEGARMIEDAKKSIEAEKMRAVTELKNQVATLSIEIAEKILKSELSDKNKQQALVDNLVEDVNLN
jgi:F-type H+-transporting ATPase subunit b